MVYRDLIFEGAGSCGLIYYAALVLLFPFYSSFFSPPAAAILFFAFPAYFISCFGRFKYLSISGMMCAEI